MGSTVWEDESKSYRSEPGDQKNCLKSESKKKIRKSSIVRAMWDDEGQIL